MFLTGDLLPHEVKFFGFPLICPPSDLTNLGRRVERGPSNVC